MKKSYSFSKISLVFLTIFMFIGCSSNKIEVPTITKRIAVSEVIENALILDIQKQNSFYILNVKNDLGRNKIEIISLKSLDIKDANIGDIVLIVVKDGVAFSIEVIQKAQKEETKDLNKTTIDSNASSNHEELSQDVIENEKKQNMTDMKDKNNKDIIFEENFVDTKVAQEESQNINLQKRTNDRKNKDIFPPKSTKLVITH